MPATCLDYTIKNLAQTYRKPSAARCSTTVVSWEPAPKRKCKIRTHDFLAIPFWAGIHMCNLEKIFMSWILAWGIHGSYTSVYPFWVGGFISSGQLSVSSLPMQWIAQWTQWIIQGGISIETCFCWPQQNNACPWTHTGKDGSFHPRAFVESAAILTLAKSWPWPTAGGFSDDQWHLGFHTFVSNEIEVSSPAPHRKFPQEPPCLAANTSWRNFEASPWRPWMKTTAFNTWCWAKMYFYGGNTQKYHCFRHTKCTRFKHVQPCSTYKFNICCEFWHKQPILPIPPCCWQ